MAPGIIWRSFILLCLFSGYIVIHKQCPVCYITYLSHTSQTYKRRVRLWQSSGLSYIEKSRNISDSHNARGFLFFFFIFLSRVCVYISIYISRAFFQNAHVRIGFCRAPRVYISLSLSLRAQGLFFSRAREFIIRLCVLFSRAR